MLQVGPQSSQRFHLFGHEDFDFTFDGVRPVLERFGQTDVEAVHLLDYVEAIGLQLVRVLVDDAEGVLQTGQRPAHLVVDAGDFPP